MNPEILPPDPVDPGDVGDFRQGTPISQWALARYLVGRALGDYASRALLFCALVVLGLAGLLFWSGPTWLGVLVALCALGFLVMRAILGAILRRVTATDFFGPDEAKLRHLVADTRGDVRRELARIGLPSHSATMPLLALRLAGRRRAETVERMRRFEVERAVPQARLDELHLLVQAQARQNHP